MWTGLIALIMATDSASLANGADRSPAPANPLAAAQGPMSAKSKRRTTAVVQVHGPTVVVFAPPRWELEAERDPGAVEELAHVRFAVADVNSCKGTTALTVLLVFASRLALRLDGRRTVIDLSRKFPDSPGAYLLKPGKKPRALVTPNDAAGLGDILSRAVGEFFGVPGCLRAGRIEGKS